MGGLFGSITIKGNRLTDYAGQTSTVGIPLPFCYGTIPVDGNIIWAGELKEHVRKRKQGKGGVKTEEYTYTLSYAIAFTEGPIFGYLTIKRGGKVVYTTDPNATVEDKAFAAKWLQKATLYYGTRTQNPDSTIEATEGAGKVSAFRDVSYIVVENDDVTNEGGAVPQYEATVIASPPDAYFTSRPYPNDGADRSSFTVSPLGGVLKPILINTYQTERNSFVVEPVGGVLDDHYRKTDSEEVYSFGVEPTGGLMRALLIGTTGEEASNFAVAAIGGNMRALLISTNDNVKTNFSVTPLGGNLNVP